MASITIAVNPEVAKAYQEADQQKQDRLTTLINLFFYPELEEKTLSEVMGEIAEKAEKRGLTPEILQSILDDEE